MSELKWDTRFNIGVDFIDSAHQRLFSIVGKLLNLNEDEAKQRYACQEGIKFFKNYAVKHFSEEEAYMRSINYSGYEVHKALHDNMLRNTLPALEHELESQNYARGAIQHFLGICVGWLNGHIMVEDHAITGKTPQKWIHQTSENEIDSLIRAILPTMQFLYRIKADPVSRRYSGEDFSSGNALCFRLSYRSLSGKPLQSFLVFEDRLVLYSLNEILGRQVKSIDKAVQSAMQLLAEKFMNCIGAHFVSDETYEHKGTNLLTFDQFLHSFDRGYPPYSLLFSSRGNGYFAFCIQNFENI